MFHSLYYTLTERLKMSKTPINVHQVDIKSLPDVITDLLIKAGHPRPNDWTRGLHPDANIVQDLNIQRFLINRQLRLLLGNCNETNTLDARYCLIDNGEIHRWQELVGQMVIPLLVQYNLPPALN